MSEKTIFEWNGQLSCVLYCHRNNREEYVVGKGILLWLIGIPLPIIILLLIFWH
ncbi:MAG: hypothetical protein V4610_20795 [Pseudomonadota bacterium]|jgi:hypothetical protein|uniref:Uncharacterized protein n=1 Tax=hydrothermal vent metagenome TaxID=652676 RepID=A0A160TML0_9ZZZZ